MNTQMEVVLLFCNLTFSSEAVGSFSLYARYHGGGCPPLGVIQLGEKLVQRPQAGTMLDQGTAKEPVGCGEARLVGDGVRKAMDIIGPRGEHSFCRQSGLGSVQEMIGMCDAISVFLKTSRISI